LRCDGGPSIFEALGIVNAVSGVIAPWSARPVMRKVSFWKADVEGFNIFYRESGPTDAQTLLLLHGFPSASHMFGDLVPRLADRFYLSRLLQEKRT
jgi:hypothetical protein